MRALCRKTGASPQASAFAATMYAMSGLAISATAFYNLITAVALIPFALWAVERDRSPFIAAAAFGLIGLAGEPVIVLSTAICVLIVGWRRIVVTLVGFAGIALYARPFTAGFDPGAFVGALGALLGALVVIYIKQLAKTEPTRVIMFYYAISNAL